jgi:hypothetical protein
MDQKIYFKSKQESAWRGKYKTLQEYYQGEYGQTYVDPKTNKTMPYYTFTKYELEIDPDEPMEYVEKYDEDRQRKETIKCINSFEYFCHKYVKILHPTKGLIPFILYNYQRKVIRDYEDNRFNIISKFRQGGLTTVTLLWGLWRCMFDTDQQVMLLSKTDREATDIGMMVDRSVENFPGWMKPAKEGKWNDHLKQFKQTGGAIKFYSPEAARGKSVTFLIIDEAAFIPDMETHWKAMWPVLSTGGSCTLVSTVNGLGNWYHSTYIDGKEGRNKFHVIDLDYWEHPDYNNPGWFDDQKKQLGEKGLLQEVLREFLGSGDTYFSTKIIQRLHEQTVDNPPSWKKFAKWANKEGRISHLEGEHSKGALWMWKEAEQGQEYIIGVDVSEGQGNNNDNSTFQVLNMATLEQVAEFYSNTVPTHVFSQIIEQIAIYYNTALVVVENMGPGGSVIDYLQNTLYYENLYFDNTKGAAANKPGVKMGATNRPLYLQSLQNRLIDNTMRINSIRFVSELHTFEYNPVTKKAEAQRGQHDDAIMAMCIALYVREKMVRNIPMGAEIPSEVSNTFKLDQWQEIKRELMEGLPEDLLDENEDDDILGSDKDAVLPIFVKRKNDSLLREFRW